MGMSTGGESKAAGAPAETRGGAPLRQLMTRFARIRSANRALPAAGADLHNADEREEMAHALRAELKELAESEAGSPGAADQSSSVRISIEERLSEMEGDLLRRFDELNFVSLRATIPRAVEAHRNEVIALLEALLEHRKGLLRRLPHVEYLITMLSTEEVEGRRNIAHDPASLTPRLTHFECDELDAATADSIAIELYQVASLDADHENPIEILRSVRERKESIGLGCLCPNVLRAVVTYNARMFNCVESVVQAGRESDDSLEALLAEAADSVSDAAALDAATAESADDDWTDLHANVETTSVFDSTAIDSVVSAMRRRIRGVPIGSCSSERAALVLDLGHLDAIEREAILAGEPTDDQDLLARTAIVGLLVRDFGAVRSQLAELGFSELELSTTWVLELHDLLGRVVAGKVASGEDYELASILSGIKAKHLLAPMAALNADKRRRAGIEAVGEDAAAAEMRKVSEEALEDQRTGGALRRATQFKGLYEPWSVWPTGRRMVAIAALLPLLLLSGFATTNMLDVKENTIVEMDTIDLADMSPYVASAYRSRHGMGGLIIGKLHPAFLRLSFEGRLETAKEMEPRFADMRATDVMLYDQSGVLQVHYKDGIFRRPHKAPLRKRVETVEAGERESDKRLKSGYAWRTETANEAGTAGAEPAASANSQKDDDWTIPSSVAEEADRDSEIDW